MRKTKERFHKRAKAHPRKMQSFRSLTRLAKSFPRYRFPIVSAKEVNPHV